MRVQTCNTLKVKHNQTSCKLVRHPILRTPLAPSRLGRTETMLADTSWQHESHALSGATRALASTYLCNPCTCTSSRLLVKRLVTRNRERARATRVHAPTYPCIPWVYICRHGFRQHDCRDPEMRRFAYRRLSYGTYDSSYPESQVRGTSISKSQHPTVPTILVIQIQLPIDYCSYFPESQVRGAAISKPYARPRGAT